MAKAARPQARGRNDDTRQRLLLAAIDVFGRHGFESASTRMLAEAADANLQAIPYYFGSKEGLYLAATQHIAERVLEGIGALAHGIRSRLQQPTPLVGDEARALLTTMLRAFAGLLLSDASAPWARLIVREQLDPTAAFDNLYERVLSPLLEVVRTLVASALGQPADSEQVRLRTMATVGQVIVLRAARATVMRQLGWQEVGPAQRAAVETLVVSLVEALVPAQAARKSADLTGKLKKPRKKS
jgi:AcrR family transcriptional regulator